MKNKILNAILSPLSGALAAPFVLLWNAFVAWMLIVVYDNLALPIASLYGYQLPDVPFYCWLALGMVVNAIKFIILPLKPDSVDPSKKELHWDLFVQRCSMIFTIIYVSYIIKWIWLC